MLLVDPTSGSEPFIPQTNGRLETDPYNFPHGLTPPLKHVRQRRFRKKLSKRVSITIKSAKKKSIIKKKTVITRQLKKLKEK